MPKKPIHYSRRDFFRITAAAGVGSAVLHLGRRTDGAQLPAKGSSGGQQLPARALGKTGVTVPVLGLGGSQDLMSKPLLLRQAFLLGVTYWDTAPTYGGGNSEAAIGDYVARYPEDRKDLHLVTKTKKKHPSQMTHDLNLSLEKLKTDYVDSYFIHGLSDVSNGLEHAAVKKWVEKTKKSGKIRFFGFSTHKNMPRCLSDAADLGWIDTIMTSYNYRLMDTDDMKRAVAACAKSGVGLVAMKTQAPFMARFWSDIGKNSDAGKAMMERFHKRGFTPEQARLKAVWENPHIASICSEMTNMTILRANTAAAADKRALSRKDRAILDTYARMTALGYCTGCAVRCESAVDNRVPISDIVRYMMYHDNYGDYKGASRRFCQIPSAQRSAVARLDYAEAERRCPQGIPIGRIMRDAAKVLA